MLTKKGEDKVQITQLKYKREHFNLCI